MRKVLLSLLLVSAMGNSIFAEATKPNKDNTEVKKEKNVKIEDIKVGEGAGIHAGQRITVHYTGTLENGTVFDSSHKRNQPFEFVYGVGQVIAGWEEGLKTMKVGGKRKITIPPELGYGSADMGSIPPNSTLIFDVELIAAK